MNRHGWFRHLCNSDDIDVCIILLTNEHPNDIAECTQTLSTDNET